MRRSTSVKLLLVIAVAFLFSGFLLRAGIRLVSTATHSIFVLALVAIVIVWATTKLK